MEFGSVPEALLDSIDFTLPADPAVTTEVLRTGHGNTKCYIGCTRWSHKDWVGTLYPKGTRDKDFLTHYARLFNTIELNATFYKSPSIIQVKAWKDKAGADFRFCPKFPQDITHVKGLENTVAETHQFLDAVRAFGDRLGPLFLLPGPQTGPSHRLAIERFMADIPADMELHLEVRHPQWFTHGFDPQLSAFLRTQQRGTVITDAAGRRDCVHMHLTTPRAFIRFVGNGLHPTDYTRIDAWVQRIKTWMDSGLEQLWFFVHQHDERHAPTLITYLIEQLNARCGTDLRPPMPQQGCPELF